MHSQPSESLTRENLQPKEGGRGKEALGLCMESFPEIPRTV